MSEILLTPLEFWPMLRSQLSGRAWTLVASATGIERWSKWCGAEVIHPDQVIATGGNYFALDSSSAKRTDIIVAFGGGAVIDASKVLAYKMGHLADRDSNLALQSKYCETTPEIFAVPTLAGSGSESTQFATIWTDDGKTSIEHPSLLPSKVFLVPEFAVSAELGLTISTALDALSHSLEAIWNKNSTNDSDRLASQAIHYITRGLSYLSTFPDKLSAIGDIMLGSGSAGRAIAQTRTALAHSISYPITSELGVPHGIASSFALAEVAEFNLEVAEDRMRPISYALNCDVADIPTAISTILRNVDYGSRLQVPRAEAIDQLIGGMIQSPRARNNIRIASEIDARSIARRAAAAASC